MWKRTLGLVLASLLLGSSSAWAGEIYRVTSKNGEKNIVYEVRFGGGMKFEQYTAFDPETKHFVYLQWHSKPPAPVRKQRDAHTGKMVSLYRFPKARRPLPVIPSIEAMKVCPLTGDRHFKVEMCGCYD